MLKRKEDLFAKRQVEINQLYRQEDYLVRMHTELSEMDERGRHSWLEEMKQTA